MLFYIVYYIGAVNFELGNRIWGCGLEAKWIAVDRNNMDRERERETSEEKHREFSWQTRYVLFNIWI